MSLRSLGLDKITLICEPQCYNPTVLELDFLSQEHTYSGNTTSSGCFNIIDDRIILNYNSRKKASKFYGQFQPSEWYVDEYTYTIDSIEFRTVESRYRIEHGEYVIYRPQYQCFFKFFSRVVFEKSLWSGLLGSKFFHNPEHKDEYDHYLSDTYYLMETSQKVAGKKHTTHY